MTVAAAEAAPAIEGAVGGKAASSAATSSTATKAVPRKPSSSPEVHKARQDRAASQEKRASENESMRQQKHEEKKKTFLGTPKSPSIGSKLTKSSWNSIGNKKILLPELIVCLTVLMFGTLVAPKDSKDDVHRLVVKGSALMAVFFILAIISTGGSGPQKVANSIGLLVTLAYLLNSSDIRNILNWIQKFYTKPALGSAAGEGITAPSAGEAVGPGLVNNPHPANTNIEPQ